MVVHYHTIVVAKVARPVGEIRCEDLAEFLSGLVSALKMRTLFEPIAIKGKYGFTGIVGIVTSHVAFHYFEHDASLHFDAYSCKAYDLKMLMKEIDKYWRVVDGHVLFVDRESLLDPKRFVYHLGELQVEKER